MPFLVEIAKLVGATFEELGGRSVAVSDSEITKENIPTLPLAMTALDLENATHNPKTNRDPQLSDEFVVEFWLANVKYRDNRGGETPYWQFYDYEAIRDKLLNAILTESRSRDDWGIQYLSMRVAVDPLAIVLTFRFSRNYIWCPPADEDAPIIGSDTINTCVAPKPLLIHQPQPDEVEDKPCL